MSKHDKRVGKNFKSARIAAKITQCEMANHLGLDQSAVVRIEQGLRKLTYEEAVMASLFVGVNLDWFWLGDDFED